jgi:hypothetical protein
MDMKSMLPPPPHVPSPSVPSASLDFFSSLFSAFRENIASDTLSKPPKDSDAGVNGNSTEGGSSNRAHVPPIPPPSPEDFIISQLITTSKNGKIKNTALLPSIHASTTFHYDAKLAKLATLRSLQRSSTTSSLQSLETRCKLTQAGLSAPLLTHLLTASLYERKLTVQRSGVESRLRELIYECVGEFTKSRERAVRRAAYLDKTVKKDRSMAVERLRWLRFCASMARDLGAANKVKSVTAASIGIEQYAIVRDFLEERVRSKISSDITVTHVVAVERPANAVRSRRSQANSNEVTEPSRSAQDLKRLVMQLAPAATAQSPPYLQPLPAPSLLLSLKSLTSLLLTPAAYIYDGRPPQVATLQPPVGSRVYICLSSRASAPPTPDGHSAAAADCYKEAVKANFIKSVYCKPWEVRDREKYSGELHAMARHGKIRRRSGSANQSRDVYSSSSYPFTTTATVATHRTLISQSREDLLATNTAAAAELEADMDSIYSYPDVLTVESNGRILHFAPATVLNLLETPAARRLRASLPDKERELLDEKYPEELMADEELCGATLFCAHLSPSDDDEHDNASRPESSTSDQFSKYPAANNSNNHASLTAPLVGCRMTPLSNLAVATLLSTYVSHDTSKKIISCLDALPDQEISMASSERMSTGVTGSGRKSGPTTPAWEPSEAFSTAVDDDDGTGGGDDVDDIDDGSINNNKLYEKHYCVVFNPSPPSHEFSEYYDYDDDGAVSAKFSPLSWENTTACLVQFTLGRSSGREKEVEHIRDVSERGPAKKVKKKWDNAILSNYCRWRACTCEATPKPAPKYLCSAHSQIKSFLDWRAVGGETPGQAMPPTSADSSRFLPKKVPQQRMDDLNLIKFASSLLVELENGKLSSTIETFCKRAAAESSEKYCTMLKKQQLEGGEEMVPHSMPWARWLHGDEYSRVVQKLGRDLQITNQIQNIERGVTSEVGRLRELGVYPSAELVLIRRQFKMLEQEFGDKADDGSQQVSDGREEVELELEFCERKRQLLRHRRMEVEGDNLVHQGDADAEAAKDKMFFNAPPNMPPSSNNNPHQLVDKRMGNSRSQQLQQQEQDAVYLREQQQATQREQQRESRRDRELRIAAEKAAAAEPVRPSGDNAKASPYTMSMKRPSMTGTQSTIGNLRRAAYK